MVMSLKYDDIVQGMEYTLRKNPKFNPFITNADRYINQIRKQRFVPGAPFPAVCIYMDRKNDEHHMALGYTPLAGVQLHIDIYCSLPSPNSTPALLTAIGKAKIETGEDAERELIYIASEIEEWLRGDSSTEGWQRRNLYLNLVSWGDIKVGYLPATIFEQRQMDNFKLGVCKIVYSLPYVRILDVETEAEDVFPPTE